SLLSPPFPWRLSLPCLQDYEPIPSGSVTCPDTAGAPRIAPSTRQSRRSLPQRSPVRNTPGEAPCRLLPAGVLAAARRIAPALSGILRPANKLPAERASRK